MLGSLMETVDWDHKQLTDFFELQPEVYQLLDAMIISSRALLMNTMENLATHDVRSGIRYMLWRTMYDYTETSLLLLLKTRIDEAYALLRMAAELCRDIARIGESQGNFEMWMNRRQLYNEESYKRVFRFNTRDQYEKYVYRLYNLASTWGVHSHQTRDMFLKPVGELADGKYVKLNVPEQEMLNSLGVWLHAFFPLHTVAAKTYSDVYSRLTPNPMNEFVKMMVLVDPVLQELRRNIK